MMQKEFAFYGRHLLLNFSGCQANLNDAAQIQQDLVAAVHNIGATVLAQVAHPFQPQGVSIVLLLAKSHASVHTYPEYRACFVDLFTCGGQIQIEPFVDYLQKCWQAEWMSMQIQERFDPAPDPSNQSPIL